MSVELMDRYQSEIVPSVYPKLSKEHKSKDAGAMLTRIHVCRSNSAIRMGFCVESFLISCPYDFNKELISIFYLSFDIMEHLTKDSQMVSRNPRDWVN